MATTKGVASQARTKEPKEKSSPCPPSPQKLFKDIVGKLRALNETSNKK